MSKEKRNTKTKAEQEWETYQRRKAEREEELRLLAEYRESGKPIQRGRRAK